ncbi:hypothetical protein [Clostridium estertheticum]|nr:hypothetical protein [Clostridium estertheticum]
MKLKRNKNFPWVMPVVYDNMFNTAISITVLKAPTIEYLIN